MGNRKSSFRLVWLTLALCLCVPILILVGCGVLDSCEGACQLRKARPYIASWQLKIEMQLSKTGKIVDSSDFSTPPSSFISMWNIASDGRIVIQAKEKSAFAVFVPVMTNGQLRWACYGAPTNEFTIDFADAGFADCGAEWRALILRKK